MSPSLIPSLMFDLWFIAPVMFRLLVYKFQPEFHILLSFCRSAAYTVYVLGDEQFWIILKNIIKNNFKSRNTHIKPFKKYACKSVAFTNRAVTQLNLHLELKDYTIYGCQYRILWAQQKREHFGKHKCACLRTPVFVVNTEGTSQIPHKEQRVLCCAGTV